MSLVLSGGYFNQRLPNITVQSATPSYTITTFDESNITTYNLNCLVLGEFQDMEVINSINCTGTINTNILKAQSYYVNNVISNSNLYANNIYLSGYQYHQIITSNVLSYRETVDANGMIDFSNIKNFPLNNSTGGINWLNQLGGLASTAANLALLGTNLADKLKEAFSPYSPTVNPLSSDEAGRIQDSLINSNSDGVKLVVDLNSNVQSRYFYQDPQTFAYEYNLVLGNTAKIISELNPASFTTANGMMTYSKTNQNTIIDLSQNALFLGTLSNVGKLDMTSISLSNDGTIRRSLTNSNGIYIDGVKYFQQNISSIMSLTSSNVTTQQLSSPNISNLNNVAGGINSNISFQTLNSNATSNNVVTNNFSMTPAGVFNAPIVNASSNYTNSLQVTNIFNSSNFTGCNIACSNISCCNLSATTITSTLFGVSNNVFTVFGDLVVKGTVKTPRISLNEPVFPVITSAYDPGIYIDSTMILDGQGRLFQNGVDKNSAAMGGIKYNSPSYDARISYGNPYAVF